MTKGQAIISTMQDVESAWAMIATMADLIRTQQNDIRDLKKRVTALENR